MTVLFRGNIVLMAMFVLMLTACGGPGEDGPASPAASSSSDPGGTAAGVVAEESAGGAAALVVADESYSFDVDFCVIDEKDIVVHGPGRQDDSGEPAYLAVDLVRETSFTTGGARVDLGASSRFESMDDFHAFDTEYFAGEHTLMIDGESFVLEAEFRSQQGESSGPGALTVDCR